MVVGRMEGRGVLPNEGTVLSMIDGLGKEGRLNDALHLLAQKWEIGLEVGVILTVL